MPRTGRGPGTCFTDPDTDEGSPTLRGVYALTTRSKQIVPPADVSGVSKTNDKRLLLPSSQSMADIPRPAVVDNVASKASNTLPVTDTLLASITGLAASSSSIRRDLEMMSPVSVCVPATTVHGKACALGTKEAMLRIDIPQQRRREKMRVIARQRHRC